MCHSLSQLKGLEIFMKWAEDFNHYIFCEEALCGRKWEYNRATTISYFLNATHLHWCECGWLIPVGCLISIALSGFSKVSRVSFLRWLGRKVEAMMCFNLKRYDKDLLTDLFCDCLEENELHSKLKAQHHIVGDVANMLQAVVCTHPQTISI